MGKWTGQRKGHVIRNSWPGIWFQLLPSSCHA